MTHRAHPMPSAPGPGDTGVRGAAQRRGGGVTLFGGIRPVSRAGALRDALAGIQLAAMNIPQALGYARIAGTPVVTGLYTLLLPLVAFAIFGSSRYLVVAADSATAAILAGGLAGMAPLASPQYVALAGMVALLTAIMLLLARLLKLGFLADFLSQTVLVGFLTGVGFQVGIAVLGSMLGLEVGAHRTVLQIAEIVRDRREVHPPTVLLSFLIVVGVLALRRFAPRFPVRCSPWWPRSWPASSGTLAVVAFNSSGRWRADFRTSDYPRCRGMRLAGWFR